MEKSDDAQALPQSLRLSQHCWPENVTPMVSIICNAYNHEKLIGDAIEGFLGQKVNFPVEILIHDDASADKTPDIVRDYAEKYPLLVKPIFQSSNQLSKGFKPLLFQIPRALGKYIALCEGDDYWIDPDKLQRQVNFLEANSDFAICFHQVQILEDGTLKDDCIANPPRPVSTIDLLARGNYIHTCSCVFRNRGVEMLGPNLAKSPLGDYYLHMTNAQYGKIYCIDKQMAVYRIHKDSTFSSKTRTTRVYMTLLAIAAILQDMLPTMRTPVMHLSQQFVRRMNEGNYDKLAVLCSERPSAGSTDLILNLLLFAAQKERDCLKMRSMLKQ